MKDRKRKERYALDDNGVTHLVSALFQEYTLCGNAFEGYSECGIADDGEGRWMPVVKGPVNCSQCVKQIMACRNVRVKQI